MAEWLAALGAHPWAYPMLEVVHIVGIALLLGNLILLEMRVWGVGASIAVAPLARMALGLVGAGFVLCAVSGLLMFGTMAEELIANRLFLFKLLLIALAAGNAVWFHARGSLERLDAMARVLALASTVLWLLVLTCGRWLGYL
ncbi:MAG: hypothetical protein KF871_10075 [Hydrogenophaga sp.]|uniref:hypothetical protein n=1 Tax=Hydrogenophaga sp. TaxID=1904254 RepID=UPI001D68D692|nr:hypothetical protein [Hydrogenophaga sp.]MBX3610233.1 hypothetical protein [Hydrogenophaga sp.]